MASEVWSTACLRQNWAPWQFSCATPREEGQLVASSDPNCLGVPNFPDEVRNVTVAPAIAALAPFAFLALCHLVGFSYNPRHYANR
jgi:hypothetical protein